MQADGSWTDIDYNDQISADGWKPNGHLNRLKAMALNYKHPESKFFNNATLLQQIEKGCPSSLYDTTSVVEGTYFT